MAETRTVKIAVRLTPHEWTRLAAAAAMRGLKLGAMLRTDALARLAPRRAAQREDSRT
jgi:hypothetical protein